MSETIAAAEPSAAPKNLASRLIGVIVSPGETFKSIAAHPKWLGALAVVLLLSAGAQFWFLSTQVGQQAMLDQQIRQSESWGRPVTDEAQAQMERMLPMMRWFTLGSMLVIGPIVTMVMAGILLGVFKALLGAEGTFKQVMAVVSHAGAVTLLQQLFVVPLNYARESMSSATNVGVLLPFLEEGSVLSRFFGMIDIFIVWWLVVLAIGLAVLFKRKTGPVFASLAGVYVAIAAVAAIVMRAVAGSQ